MIQKINVKKMHTKVSYGIVLQLILEEKLETAEKK